MYYKEKQRASPKFAPIVIMVKMSDVPIYLSPYKHIFHETA